MTAAAGIGFARESDAEVIGLFVAPELQYPIYIETMPPSYLSDQEYRSSMRTAGETYLNNLLKLASDAGVRASCQITFSDSTALTIVEAAEKNHCDLIFMGSHGQSGWNHLLLGSVTSKVLALSSIPVLVYRSQGNHT